MRKFFQAAALAAMLLATLPGAQAAMRAYHFSGSLDSGAYSGAGFSGEFSFDDAGLTGVANEWALVDTLGLTLLGNTYGLADGDVPAEAAFLDGALLGLSYSVSSSDPQFALIPGMTDVSEAFFAYDSAQGLSGTGGVAYAAVPEPGTLALTLLAGLGLVGWSARRRRTTA